MRSKPDKLGEGGERQRRHGKFSASSVDNDDAREEPTRTKRKKERERRETKFNRAQAQALLPVSFFFTALGRVRMALHGTHPVDGMARYSMFLYVGLS